MVEQKRKFAWDTRSGWQTTRRWKGPDSALFALMAQLQSAGYNFTAEQASGVNYIVTATIGYSFSGGVIGDNPVDVWELGANKAEKDLLQADVPIINGLTKAEKQIIRDNYLSPPATTTATTNNPPTLPSDLTGNALTVYSFMVEGFTGLPVNAPTIRNIKTVSSVNSVQAAVNGQGTLFTLGTINPPATLNIDLSTLGTAGKTGYVYAWFKDFPTARCAAFNKTQITQEWVYGLYPTAVFGTPQ